VSFSLGYKQSHDLEVPLLDSQGNWINQDSYMIFGGVNETQIEGKLHEFSLINDKWWTLRMNEFRYGPEVIQKSEGLLRFNIDWM